MKRLISILLILCIGFTFCSCSTNNKNKENTDYQNLISKSKEDVLQTINISKNDIDELKDGTVWKLPTMKNHFGYDFTEYLLFYKNNDTMYGYWYVLDFEKQDEQALTTYKDILSQITKEKGDAQTYIGLDNKFSNVSNPLENLSNNDKAHFIESWYINKDKNFVLDVELQKFDKQKISLSVKYSIQNVSAIGSKK